MTKPTWRAWITGRTPVHLGQEGQIAGVEGLALGILVFVLGTLAIVDSWAVIDAKLAIDTAATQAVRAFVVAPDPQQAPLAAQMAAAQVITASGRAPRAMALSISGTLQRCTVVAVKVAYPVRLALLPILKGFGPVVVVSGRQAELVDPLRSGATGTVGRGGSCG